MDGRKRRKLFALCVLGTLFFMMASIVPSFAPVVPVDASSATITITKVTPTELQPGDTKEVAVTMKNNGAWDAKDITLSFQGSETISFIGPTSVHVNTVNSWKSKTGLITVHVKEEAPNGAYTIPITCTWRGIHFNPNVGYDVTTDLMEANLGITFNVVGHGLIK